MSTVGVFSCQFNGWYEEYLDGWFEACLAAKPDQIVLVSDRIRPVPNGVDLVVVDSVPDGARASFFLNHAVGALDTEWCWNMDIDDLIFVDGLSDVRHVDADVFAAGMRTTQGSVYVPRGISSESILASPKNYMNAGSAFRKMVWSECGGYPDVRIYDWGLWRRLARIDARFSCSTKANYLYRMGHESLSSRSETGEDIAEVMAL
jgi:hypothetical protein